MSDTQISLRRKIGGAQKLESVVRTMKAVAASNIGQYEAAVRALVDYERSVNLGLSVCFRQGETLAGSFPARERRAGAIVFGSDQGLVGQFNEVLAAFLKTKLSGMPVKKLWVVGERMHSQLTEMGFSTSDPFNVPNSVPAITPLVTQLQIASEGKQNVRCTDIYVFHNRPSETGLFEPTIQRLLPLDAQWKGLFAKILWPNRNFPEIFGPKNQSRAALIREYLFISLFKACAESLASENVTRLTAMQRAEKNIDSLLDRLNRSFYRLRQNSIDAELFDVIAGFTAL